MRSLIAGAVRRMQFNPVTWWRDTWRLRRLVRRFEPPAHGDAAGVRFAVVVTPWLGTAVPWFSLVCGLFLASRGSTVTFVLDDLPFGDSHLRSRFIVACIRSVLRLLRGRYRIVELRAFASSEPLSAAARERIASLARLNATWALRGESVSAGRGAYTSLVAGQLAVIYGAVGKFVEHHSHDVIFVPGGVYGSTGVWVERASAAGTRVASYDSGGYGTLMLAAAGVACQLQDIPHAFSLLKERSERPDEHALIVAAATEEMQKRQQGADKFTSQMVDSSEAADPSLQSAVLVALNSSWDSAALGLHAVFDGSIEWLMQTVEYLLSATSKTVIVRQHPAERLAIARTSDDYRALLTQRFGTHERLRFIAADDRVNSYDLLSQVSAVVVHTSTFGIEAAAQGKPVITQSHSYYSDLGFVFKATTLEQYQNLLHDASLGRLNVAASMSDDALRCYYLTQCCNWVFSPFNPEGFEDWSRRELADILKLDSVQKTIESLETNVPVAFLNHLGRCAALGHVS